MFEDKAYYMRQGPLVYSAFLHAVKFGYQSMRLTKRRMPSHLRCRKTFTKCNKFPLLDFSPFRGFLANKMFGKFIFLRSFYKQKNSGKVTWLQVSLCTRGCRLYHSKQANCCPSGTVQTGKAFLKYWYKREFYEASSTWSNS